MKRIIKRIFLIIILLFVSVGIILGGSGYIYYRDVIEQAPLEEKIELLYQQYGYTTIDDMSPHFINALIAVEDRRFELHGGFDPIGIVRAGITNFYAKKIVQGGSTITQQLAKNLYFTSEQTIIRKVAEIFMAMNIERHYTKDEIFEFYANIIFYGKNSYGIGVASWEFFDKAPSELTIEQSAFLAGLPQAPSLYSVNTNLGNARQQEVLAALIDVGYIDENLKLID
ncbi:MAG: hypothetical protein ATN36_02445 [Epulopiscium sp. Nele67-Bin005]|nr:MAG: hypothetical protein ATN36_02445 [Epulopiscium sp. Nele67-Bin005]